MLQNIFIIFLRGLGVFISTVFWLGLWILGLGVLLGLLMRLWPGDLLRLVRLINYLMPWLLIFLIPAVTVAALLNHKWLAVTLLASTLFIIIHFAPLFVSGTSAVQPGRASLKVMSYNVWRDNRRMNEVAAVILKEKPDILLLQELTPTMVRPLIDALGDFYHNSSPNFNYEKRLLQAVLSRFPISPLGAYPGEGQAQKVLIETPETAITVINVHPRRQLSWLKRYHQISALLEADIATTNRPLILGGDFNTTEESQTGRLIKRYLSDAHTKAGKGFGFTFPAPVNIFGGKVHIPPLVRIDHIYYNDYFVSKSTRTLKESGGSDHLPVVAELYLKK